MAVATIKRKRYLVNMSSHTHPVDTIFGDLHDPFAIPRKEMLPGWIKAFCYIFIVFAVLAPIGYFLRLININLFGIRFGSYEIALYGLYESHELTLTALILIVIFVFKGIAALGLITEKSWGARIGMVDGGIGIAISLLTMLVLPFFDGFNAHFSWELFFLIPYQARLWKIRPQWEENRYALQKNLQ